MDVKVVLVSLWFSIAASTTVTLVVAELLRKIGLTGWLALPLGVLAFLGFAVGVYLYLKPEEQERFIPSTDEYDPFDQRL